jgi:signal transduction histidine kinase
MTADTSDKHKILVVDDETGPRESLRVILSPKYEIITAENGKIALELLEQHTPDMVISDIRMPQMTGTELLREVKKRDPEIPVVLITGYATVQSAQEAVRASAYDYINKPYDVGEIEEVVSKALAENQARRERERTMNKLQQWNLELEEQIGQLDQKATLGELSAELIHDLNNPMSVLRGYISLLEDSLGRETTPEEQSEQQKEFLEVIKSQVERCVKLTRNFLDFARSPRELWSEENINELIHDTLFVLRVRMLKQNIELKSYLDTDLPKCFVMATPMQQAMYNLVSNAIDAMAENAKSGTLTLTSATDEVDGQTTIRIGIRDTGPGIPNDIVERIFNPFFTTKGKKKGTGLGLAICKRVLDQHAGTVNVNTDDGKGTEFILHIPLRTQAPDTE